MSVSYAPVNLRLPAGFQNLLEGLAREILRTQPDDLYGFAAGYFKERLIYREETGIDDAKIGAEMEKRTKGDGYIPISYDDPKVQGAVVTIQSGYRGFRDRKRTSQLRFELKRKEDIALGEDLELKEATEESGQQMELANETATTEDVDQFDENDPELNKAAVKIQSNFRGHAARKEFEKHQQEDSNEKSNVDDKQEDAEQVEPMDIDLDDPELNKAAVKIQATFKGHKVRKEISDTKDDKESEPEDLDMDLNDPALSDAAVKIQSNFRGFKVRKELQVSPNAATETTEEAITDGDNTDVAITTDETAAIEEVQSGIEKESEVRGVEETETEEIEIKKESEVIGEDENKVEAEMDIQPEPLVKDEKEEDRTNTVAESKVDTDKEIEVDVKASEKIDTDVETKVEDSQDTAPKETEEVDVDLEDPELDKAATKIQSVFRGHQARKKQEPGDNEAAEES